MRLLLSYEHLFGPVSVGANLGLGFGGGGPTSALFPHVEAKAKAWFRGSKGFETGGFLPYFQLGVGLAQAAATVKEVGVYSCGDPERVQGTDGTFQTNLRNAEGVLLTDIECLSKQLTPQERTAGALLYPDRDPYILDAENLDATRTLGNFFISGSLGFLYALGADANHGPTLNLGIMYLLPYSGIVLQPSAGYSVGF
jgi:hypothetical protein